jgi:hypothetical protein
LGAKRGKIALIVVLFGAAGYFAYAYFFRPGPLQDSIHLVCVAHGTQHWLSRDNVTRIPMTNPDTKEDTLLPCSPGDGGALQVDEHYRAALDELGAKNKFVDPETLLVRPRS